MVDGRSMYESRLWMQAHLLLAIGDPWEDLTPGEQGHWELLAHEQNLRDREAPNAHSD